MFAVATIAYILLVGDEKSTLSLLKSYKQTGSCCSLESPKLVLATAKHPSQKRKIQGQGRDNEHAVISTIRACARAKDLKGALAAFNNFKANTAGTVSPQVHNCFIDARLHCDDFHGALEHFRSIAASGTADVVTYNTVLKA